MPRNLSYKADLLEDLKDLEYAAAYLSAAMADSRESFLMALRDVAESEKGIATVAEEAQVNRENLYRTLSKKGNPRYSTFMSVMAALGFSLKVESPHKSPAGTSVSPSTSASVSITTGGRHKVGSEAYGTYDTNAAAMMTVYAGISPMSAANRMAIHQSAEATAPEPWVVDQLQRQEAKADAGRP